MWVADYDGKLCGGNITRVIGEVCGRLHDSGTAVRCVLFKDWIDREKKGKGI